MTKITPGPWTASPHAHDPAKFSIMATDREGYLRVVADIIWTDEQGAIDATAIAAVPKLIEALIAVNRELKPLAEHDRARIRDDETTPFIQAFAKSDAALRAAGVIE